MSEQYPYVSTYSVKLPTERGEVEVNVVFHNADDVQTSPGALRQVIATLHQSFEDADNNEEETE